MTQLAGKIALVTGAAKNVGKVIARELAARGAHILLNYFHSHEAAKQTKVELEEMGARVDLFRASVAQQRQVERMFDEILQRYGYLDILVNNAASGALVPLEQITEEALDKALNTNFKGSLWCARRAAPLMAGRGGGSIINISALGGGQLVMANYVACGPAKAAVETLTRYLAAEFAPLNVRVNTASAGMLHSEVADSFPRAAEMQDVVIRSTPMGRLGSPQDLARLVAFLASDDAAWVTGQVVLADGGLSLGSTLLSPPRQALSSNSSATTPLQVQIPPPAQSSVADGLESPVPSAGADDDDDEIAIVGMGLVVPGANDPEQYWRILLEGGDFFIDVPLSRWDNRLFLSADHAAEDKTYQNKSAFVTAFAACPELQDDGRAFADHEYSTLWLRHSLVEALRHVKRRDDDRCAFVVGYTADGSQHLEEAAILSGIKARSATALDAMGVPDGEKQQILGEVGKALDEKYARASKCPSRFLPHRVGETALHGVLPPGTEVLMVDTACSSSLYAIDIGIKGLRSGRHDIAVCGGAFALAPRGSVLFAKLHGISTSGEVRAFDKTSDGVLFADGAGVIVLKTLGRARRDGDTVLALVKAFGASSDGKGKAIYAPSPAGQKLAIDRALDGSAAERGRVDWVIAHATGTPAGDLAEFTTLRNAFEPGRPVYVTSNKSLIGHTGWAAGVVSVIQAILGLQHDVIPPQHRFREAPATFEIDKTTLTIPQTAIPWPRTPARPREVSISGFGFGGTNAHLVVEEYVAGANHPRVSKRSSAERLAIVAWSAHVPALDSRERVTAWLRGEGTLPDTSFGEFYAPPPFDKVRMPPGTARTIDRCQLMILECAHDLKSRIGDVWEKSRAKAGVFVGHMGTTRNAVLYGARCYADEIHSLFARCESAAVPRLADALTREIRRLVPASNEDSFPGSMPNVIPARIANYFDLKGPNMTVDTGESSTLAALDVAGRYLRAGDIELALVGGINGNTTPEMQHIVADMHPGVATALAEGAFLFAVVTETTAREAGLQILGLIDECPTVIDDLTTPTARTGARRHGSRNYLGAESALHLLEALCQPAGSTSIVCDNRNAHPSRPVRVSVPPSESTAMTSAGTRAVVPAQFCNNSEYEPGQPAAVKRYVATLKDSPLVRQRASIEFLPSRTLVITDADDPFEQCCDVADDVYVISTTASEASRGRRWHVPAVTPEAVADVFKQIDVPIEHVRLITSMGDESGDRNAERLLALHDLTFLVLKSCGDQLVSAQGSFVSLFLDGVRSGTLHPFAGLFTGFVKCASFEMPGVLTFAVFTTAGNPAVGIAQAVRESAARRLLPVAIYDGENRKTMFLDQVDANVAVNTPSSLGRDSVVVAVGGARGITAEILKAVAEHFRPMVYVIGSNPIDTYPPDVFEGSDEQFAARRQQYIRDERLRDPKKNLGLIDKAFNRMVEARAARQNLAVMERHCGPGRVRYLACDIRDRAQLRRIFDEIFASERPIDLLINAAGLNRSAPIANKAFDEFRMIRDLKVRGYLNLKDVLKDRAPRTWCNFGSLLGFTGQIGEADYASGNDFLAKIAQYANHVQGLDEYTIGWTLWGSVGLGAKPLTKAYFEKAGLYSNMATGEGIYHFVRELQQTPHVPSTVHVGAAEQAAIDRLLPGFFAERAVPDTRESFYLGRLLASSGDEMVFERVFDLETDRYLEHHVVNGFATLPGTFVTEIAAEASARLAPGLEVIAFEDVEFQHYLRVYGRGMRSPKKIRARIAERSRERTIVQVQISADVTAPDGRVLTRDKMHFRLNVILGSEFPAAPLWEPWPSTGEISLPDPYHFAAAPVLLTGMFASTTNTRVHSLGKRADYRIALAPDDPVFSRFRVPCILLDGLARTAALTLIDGEYLPLIAPRTIRRIDVYEKTNDCLLAGTGGIQLYGTPRDLDLTDGQPRNRFVATRPNGRMIVQIKDVTGVLLGYVHRTSGEYVTAAAMEARKSRPLGFATTAH